MMDLIMALVMLGSLASVFALVHWCFYQSESEE